MKPQAMPNLLCHIAPGSPKRLIARLISSHEKSILDVNEVTEMVRRVAGGSVDADEPFMDAGIDSLGAVELRNQLQRATSDDVSLPTTLIFDYPTARQVEHRDAAPADRDRRHLQRAQPRHRQPRAALSFHTVVGCH